MKASLSHSLPQFARVLLAVSITGSLVVAETETTEPDQEIVAEAETNQEITAETNQEVEAVPTFTTAELDQMLAPIALYPDALLSQILMAATYPLEVVMAARWVRDNPKVRDEAAIEAVEDMGWDPSVQALVAFPSVLETMDKELEWTQHLGDAVLAQEDAVMERIQALRAQASNAGSLDTVEHVKVIREKEVIVIEPASPTIIRVPYYNPRVIYGGWFWETHPPIFWGPYPGHSYSSIGFSWGHPVRVSVRFHASTCNWHRRQIVVLHPAVVIPHHHVHIHTRHVIADRYHGYARWHHNPVHRRGVHYHHHHHPHRHKDSVADRHHRDRGRVRDHSDRRNRDSFTAEPNVSPRNSNIWRHASRSELDNIRAASTRTRLTSASQEPDGAARADGRRALRPNVIARSDPGDADPRPTQLVRPESAQQGRVRSSSDLLRQRLTAASTSDRNGSEQRAPQNRKVPDILQRIQQQAPVRSDVDRGTLTARQALVDRRTRPSGFGSVGPADQGQGTATRAIPGTRSDASQRAVSQIAERVRARGLRTPAAPPAIAEQNQKEKPGTRAEANDRGSQHRLAPREALRRLSERRER